MNEESNTITTQIHSSQDPNIIVNSTHKYSLTATLSNNTLHMDLKLYDIEQETVSFFELSLNDSTLPSDLAFLFGGVHRIFELCFLKKQNYQIGDNGVVVIHYRVSWEDEGDTENRQISLHFISIPKNQVEMLKEVIKKIKLNQKDLLHKIQQMSAEKSKMIVPNHSQSIKHFQITSNHIKYQNIKNQWAIISFSTIFIDKNQYQFSISSHTEQLDFFIGVISEENLPLKKHCLEQGTKMLGYYSYGMIYQNGQIIRKTGKNCNNINQFQIKVIFSRSQQKIALTLKDSNQTQTFDFDSEDMAMVPFISTYYRNTSFFVTLK